MQNMYLKPKVGDIVEWDCFCEDEGWISMRTEVIEHNGELWLNGCGSFKELSGRHIMRVVQA